MASSTHTKIVLTIKQATNCTSRPREGLKQKKNIAEKYENLQNALTKGSVKNDVTGVIGNGCPKLVTKSDI